MRAALATVDLDAIRHNLARVRAVAPSSRVLAVVKADAYGHGLERVARALSAADGFGVASLDDAERLRAIGVRQRIVLLAGFDDPRDLAMLRALDLDSVLHAPEQLRMLELERGSPIRVWPKLDTGMHRLGFAWTEARALAARLAGLAGVAPEPVWMTHFASADQPDAPLTAEQLTRFATATAGLGGQRSLANSAATLLLPGSRADWVRPGGLLYGLSTIAGRTGADLGLKPAMRVTSRLIAVKTVAAGAGIGYASTYVAPRAQRIGILAFGYGDGYPRHASNRAEVALLGRRAAVLGRVSMDLLCIDLDRIPEAEVGTEVELWGSALPVEQLAEAADTIGYELTCGITRRVRFETLGASAASACSRLPVAAG
jgi:alanine racemase